MNAIPSALQAPYSIDDSDVVRAISTRIPGWSTTAHFLYFKALLAAYPEMKRFLMLGVYHGRDIAFILDILTRYHPGRVMEIIGVDRFEATACADWPADKIAEPWEKAVGAAPPSYLSAVEHTRSPFVTIMAMDDEKFLRECPVRFDCAYLDTSHDEATILRQIAQLRPLVDGIFCGDDYSNAGTWGVQRAVEASFSTHSVFRNWIWHTPASALLPESKPTASSA